MQYELYKMLPFPIPHNSSNIYTYIQPSFPYILLITNKVYYALLENLEVCPTADTSERICHIKYVTRTAERPTCETTLITARRVPSSCRTHMVQADFEIWYYIQNNKWIFITAQSLQLTLTCSSTHIEDVELKSAGLIRLKPQCKGYTEATVLEPSQRVITNRSHNLMMYKTAEDNCCPKHHGNSTITPMQLTSIKGTNIGAEDFKYVNHKLKQLNILLQEQLNKPIIAQYSPWYMVMLSVIISTAGIILIVNFLRWCGILRPIIRYLCLAKGQGSIGGTHHLHAINTNVNAGPVARTQLSQALEEDNRCGLEEREFHPQLIHNTNERNEDDFSTRPIVIHGLRRSTSRAPSVNMD